MSMIVHSAAVETRQAHLPLTMRQSVRGGLAAPVTRALRAMSYPCLRRIDVSIDCCGALLLGTVRSYFMKQMVQEIAMRAAGAVWNEIEVNKEDADAYHSPMS